MLIKRRTKSKPAKIDKFINRILSMIKALEKKEDEIKI